MTLPGLFCTSIRTEPERQTDGHNFLNTEWIFMQKQADNSLSSAKMGYRRYFPQCFIVFCSALSNVFKIL